MNDSKKLRDAIRDFIIDYADVDPDDPDFTDDVNLFDAGYIDSLGATEILLFLEDTFNVRISQEDITLYPMDSINDMVDVLESKLLGW